MHLFSEIPESSGANEAQTMTSFITTTTVMDTTEATTTVMDTTEADNVDSEMSGFSTLIETTYIKTTTVTSTDLIATKNSTMTSTSQKDFDISAFVDYYWENHFVILWCVVIASGCAIGLIISFTVIGCISCCKKIGCFCCCLSCCKKVCKCRSGSYTVNSKREKVRSISYNELADLEMLDDHDWVYAHNSENQPRKQSAYSVERSPTPMPVKRVKVLPTDEYGNMPPYVLRSRTTGPKETNEQPSRVRVVEREIPIYKTQMSLNVNKETTV